MYNMMRDFGWGGAGWSGSFPTELFWFPVLGFFGLAFIFLVVWSVFWKGLALWHAAKHHQPWWFVVMLVVNTAGILEIAYLFLVRKMKPGDLFK